LKTKAPKDAISIPIPLRILASLCGPRLLRRRISPTPSPSPFPMVARAGCGSELVALAMLGIGGCMLPRLIGLVD